MNGWWWGKKFIWKFYVKNWWMNGKRFLWAQHWILTISIKYEALSFFDSKEDFEWWDKIFCMIASKTIDPNLWLFSLSLKLLHFLGLCSHNSCILIYSPYWMQQFFILLAPTPLGAANIKIFILIFINFKCIQKKLRKIMSSTLCSVLIILSHRIYI